MPISRLPTIDRLHHHARASGGHRGNGLATIQRRDRLPWTPGSDGLLPELASHLCIVAAWLLAAPGILLVTLSQILVRREINYYTLGR